ncbi:MAG TPA: hypothetical protein EYQ48_00565 [Candidatus Lambdaproteobacteria bacterium]|jgi:hypothetical protein|nr:hypothetical protein [Candidatus Lambdaproteobacteria bacterium]
MSMIVTLKQWAAWAPTVETESEWIKWISAPTMLPKNGSPKLPYVPTIRRRRLSDLGRMVMQVIFNFKNTTDLSSVNSVLASHHGELKTTLELTDLLINGDLFSPQKFSHSVHNTASGLFSIEVRNRQPSTALSGGEASFCYGFLEALTMQHRYPEQNTLLVVADESVPACFAQYGRSPEFPYAAAFLFGSDLGQEGYRLKLTLESNTKEVQPMKFPQALMFVRWLLSEDKMVSFLHKRLYWTWEKLSV